MQITRVELENFRKHAALEVDFAPGVNALIGQNGSGKSSVLMGIKWALFDYAPVKQDAMVHRGAKMAAVSMEFMHAGEAWRVHRDTRGTYEVYRGADQVSSGKLESVAAIRMALGMGGDVDLSKLCRDALAPDQGALVDPFTLSKTKRVEFWGPVLGLDAYRVAYVTLRDPAKDLDMRERGAREAMNALRATLHTLLPEGISVAMIERDPKACYQASLASLEEAQGRQNETEGQWTRARDELEVRRRIVQRRSHLEEMLERNRATLSQVRAQLAKIDAQLGEDRPRLLEARQEQAALDMDGQAQQDYQSARTEHAGMTARLEMLGKAIQEQEQKLETFWAQQADAQDAQGRLADLQAHLEQLEAQANDLTNQHYQYLAEWNRHKRGLGALEPGANCPTCGAPMTQEMVEAREKELKALIEQAEADMGEVTDHLTVLRGGITETNRQKQDAERVIARSPDSREIELTQRLLAENRCDQETLTTRAVELQDQLGKLAQRVEVAQAVQQQYMETVKEISGLESRIHQNETWKPAQEHERDILLSDIESAKGELAALPAETSETIAIMVQQVQALERTYNECVGRAHRLEYQSANLERAIQVVKQIAEHKQEAERAEHARQLLERCRKAISEAGPQVAAQVMARLSALAQRYWAQMGKGTPLEWTGDFQVIADGLELETYLSGGQQVAAALACRIAVAQFQANLSWLVLDEPTTHLDAAARFGLAESLERLGLAQVIVVSHDDSFSAIASHTINLD